MKPISILIAFFILNYSKAATFTVTTGTDNVAGFVGCMRWAITQANATVGADVINFSGGFFGSVQSGAFGIFPAFTDNAGVTINGWSQSGTNNPNTNPIGSPSNANYMVQFQDPYALGGAGLDFQSSNNIIQGCVLNGYGSSASVNDYQIRIQGDNNKVIGCYIGPDLSGANVIGGRCEYGIGIVSGNNNQIGDGTPGGLNVISYNTNNIYIAAGTNTIIKGNYIGTTDLLTEYVIAPYTDQDYGIYIAGGTGHVIGGTGAGDKNYIAYNDVKGINLLGAATTATIRRNLIYANPAGPGSISISLNGAANGNRANPLITGATLALISGTAIANDIVEVYKNTSGGLNCQDLNIFLGQATATAGGAWSLAAATSSGDRIVATGTNSANTQTSEVSPCWVVVLPIELMNFDAAPNGDVVDLSWCTASETNNDYFTLEKSSDGINFKPFSYVKGAGTSSGKLCYNEVDNEPASGISYYRLKQTDYDGKYAYSEVVSVSFNSGANGYVVFPNPSSTDKLPQLSINPASDSKVVVVLRDVTGKELNSQVVEVEKGINTVVSVGPKNLLSTGVYFITATSDDYTYNQRLIVR